MSGEERSARRAGEERIAGGTRERGKTDDIDRDRTIGFAYWALVASVEKVIAVYCQLLFILNLMCAAEREAVIYALIYVR